MIKTTNKFSKYILALTIAFIASIILSLGSVAYVYRANSNAELGSNSVESYFTVSSGVTLEPNTNTPDYLPKRNSLLVKSDNSGTVTYNTVIDVSNLTKDDLLFEWQPIPSVKGEPELTQMIIRLEDAENPKYYVNISMRRYTYKGNTESLTTHVLAQPNTVSEYYGWRYSDKASEHKMTSGNLQLGTMIKAPWVGEKGGYTDSMKIYFDNEERAIYTALSPKEPQTFDTDGDGKLLVVDMDNQSHMGADKTKHWGGFPSNKIKITFTTAMLETPTAGYMIYEIDGQKFDGVYLNDVTAPTLTVDQQGYADDQAPKAVVGKDYPFFNATAIDKIYGETEVRVRVFNGDNEIYHTGKAFTPQTAGEYKVVYQATDKSLNVASKEFTVTAINQVDLTAIETSFINLDDGGVLNLEDDELKNDSGRFPINLYYPVQLPQMSATGGSGNPTVEISVSNNGREIEVVDGEFTPTSGGVYDVKYIIRDYINNTSVETYTAEAVYTDVPLLKSPVLPSAISVDRAIELPKVNSEFYTIWGQALKTYDKINVYKADGTTLINSFDGSSSVAFTPKSDDGEKIVVEYYSAKDSSSQPALFRQEIAVKNSEKLIDRFIVEEGIIATEQTLSIDFAFDADGKTVKYINPLMVFGGLNFEFSVPKEKNNFTQVDFTFIDSIDSDIKLTINIYKNSDNTKKVSYISINGGAKQELKGDFYGNSYDSLAFSLLANGNVSHSDLGLINAPKDFVGFTSGYVYMEMTIDGKQTGDATVSLQLIKNQVIGDAKRDYIVPSLYVTEEPVGIAKLGSYIEIPKVYVGDVYDVKCSVSVEVTFNDKVIYSASNDFGKLDGAKFLAYDYGTYTIVYYAQDMTGNSINKQYSVRIRDSVAPVLKINGEMATTVELGEVLKFPTVTATDNVDKNLTVYATVIDPMNVFTVVAIDEEYTVNSKGRYIVQFFCKDASQNQVFSQTYYLTVE